MLELNPDGQRRWTSRKRTAFFPRNWLTHLRAINLDNRNVVHGNIACAPSLSQFISRWNLYGKFCKTNCVKCPRFCTLTSYGKSIHLYYWCDKLTARRNRTIIWTKQCTAWPTLGLFSPRDNCLMQVYGRIIIVVKYGLHEKQYWSVLRHFRNTLGWVNVNHENSVRKTGLEPRTGRVNRLTSFKFMRSSFEDPSQDISNLDWGYSVFSRVPVCGSRQITSN